MSTTDKTIILHLVPLPCDVPVAVRLRQALKTLLRRDSKPYHRASPRLR
jgi:hypothetical protein